jgi:hypothetical protein
MSLNRAAKIHDSTVTFSQGQDSIVLELVRTLIHETTGTPGLDNGRGWRQNTRITFHEGELKGAWPSESGKIFEGLVKIGAEESNWFVPVPLDTKDPVQLTLEFMSGEKATISSKGAKVELIDSEQ